MSEAGPYGSVGSQVDPGSPPAPRLHIPAAAQTPTRNHMPIHFTPEEMRARRDRAARAVTDAGLDALLMFKQESM